MKISDIKIGTKIKFNSTYLERYKHATKDIFIIERICLNSSSSLESTATFEIGGWDIFFIIREKL